MYILPVAIDEGEEFFRIVYRRSRSPVRSGEPDVADAIVDRLISGEAAQIVPPEDQCVNPAGIDILMAEDSRRCGAESIDAAPGEFIRLRVVEAECPFLAGIERESAVVGNFVASDQRIGNPD